VPYRGILASEKLLPWSDSSPIRNYLIIPSNLFIT
jgi:hypothetical protein